MFDILVCQWQNSFSFFFFKVQWNKKKTESERVREREKVRKEERNKKNEKK